MCINVVNKVTNRIPIRNLNMIYREGWRHFLLSGNWLKLLWAKEISLFLLLDNKKCQD